MAAMIRINHALSVTLVGLSLASCTSSSSDGGSSGSTSSSGGSSGSGTLAIKSFTASTDWVVAGTAVTLSWETTGATRITLDGSDVTGTSTMVSPTTTTVYHLYAYQGTNPTAVGASATVYAAGPLTTADLGLTYKTGGPVEVIEAGFPEAEYFTAHMTTTQAGVVGFTASQSHSATTWSCTNGALAGNQITFPDGCTVTDSDQKACTAKVTPFVLRAFTSAGISRAGILWSPYSFTWSGAGCAAAGQTEEMKATMALAPL